MGSIRLRTRDLGVLLVVLAICAIVLPYARTEASHEPAPVLSGIAAAPRPTTKAPPILPSKPVIVHSVRGPSGGPYYLGKLSLGYTGDEVVAILGEPLRKSETSWVYEQNGKLLRVDYEQDRVMKIQAAGHWPLEYDFPNPATVVPVYPLRRPVIAYGASSEEIRAAHGKPAVSKPQTWIYQDGRGELTLTFKGGKVAGMALAYRYP